MFLIQNRSRGRDGGRNVRAQGRRRNQRSRGDSGALGRQRLAPATLMAEIHASVATSEVVFAGKKGRERKEERERNEDDEATSYILVKKT